MRKGLHHLEWRLLPVLVCAGLTAACAPSWTSGVPVSQGSAGPFQVQRPAAVTVLAGDTVYSIARRYSLPVRELIEINGLRPPYQLAPGTVLRLPGGGDYVVQKGDTLSVLARRFKVDFNSLAAVNNKRPPYVIHIGERLTLPSSKGGGAPASVPPSSGGLVIASPNAVPSAQNQPPGQNQGPVSTSPPPSREPMVQAPPSAADPAVAPPPPRSGSTFLWPVRGDILAEFGPLAGRGQHNDGINIAAAKGTPVLAADNGVVAYVGNELKGFGNLLLVKHADGWMTAYAHAEKLLVRRGDRVRRGQTIATVGMSGNASQPQLHFEIRRGTEAVNPVEYLREQVALAIIFDAM